jgi:hypothetical protein
MSQEQQAEVHADNDRRRIRYWQEWEVQGREMRSVLCVATSLELRPGHAGFDEGQLQQLIEEARAVMGRRPNPIDMLRLVPEDVGSSG